MSKARDCDLSKGHCNLLPKARTLDRATLKLLDGLARREGARTAERNLKIGTVLVRDYQGRRHTVTVEPDGYVWEGNPYSSLSAIARAITGTAWSGPRFFAVKSSGDRKNDPAPRAAGAAPGIPQNLNHPQGRAKPRPGNPPCEPTA